MSSVPKISTMITFRQRRFDLVNAFVKCHRSDVSEALERQLAGGDDEDLPFGPPPDPLTSTVWAGLVEPLLGRLRDALNDLIEAERRHLDELDGQALRRQRRDRAIAETRRVLLDLRQVYRGLYGRAAAAELGFENRITDRPLALLRQAERVHGRFSDAGEEAGLVPLYSGLELGPQRALNHLEPSLLELRQAMDEVHDHLGRAQRTKVTKDRALRGFDAHYRSTVRILIAALQLSGQSELAAKIPVSLRRSRKKTG